MLRDGTTAQKLGKFVREGVAIMSQQVVSIRPEKTYKKNMKTGNRRLKAPACCDDIQPKCGISQASNVVNEDGEGYLGGSERMDLVRLTQDGLALQSATSNQSKDVRVAKIQSNKSCLLIQLYSSSLYKGIGRIIWHN